MFDLITIGDCMIDAFHILTDHEFNVSCSVDTKQCQLCMTYADKIPVQDLRFLVAGNAANNAVGASRLGLQTALYTVLGTDDRGKQIRETLDQEGVQLDYVISQPQAVTNYSTVLSFRGERTILVYHTEREFHLPRMAATRFVYLTSLPVGAERITPDLINYLKETNAKLVYQPGTFQLRLGAAKSRELLKITNTLILNKEEAEDYVGKPRGSEPELLLRSLIELGPETTVMTDGRHGAYAMSGQEAWFLPIHPKVKRLESTGAGDAFATGFTAARTLGKSVPEAMRWGTLNAEGVIQQIGPQAGLLTREAMEFSLTKVLDWQPQSLLELTKRGAHG